MKKRLIHFIFAVLISISGFGQVDFSAFLNSGLQDINTLGKAYLSPYGKGFGSAMNAGWYNTAKPHKLFGFDLTINSTLVMIPSSDHEFDMNEHDWNVITYDANNSTTPTISGGDGGIPVGIQLDEQSEINNLYNLPKGTNVGFVPLPMLQFGFGLPKGTDFQFRYFPNYEIESYGELSMFGFGLRHDFKQWIPVINKLPFDMSLQGAWSKLNAIYSNINYYPIKEGYIDAGTFDYIDPALDGLTTAQIEAQFYNTQEFVLTSTAWNANLLISKKLSVLTVYGSIGYSSSNFEVALNGKYLMPNFEIDINDTDDGIYASLESENIEKDPVNFNIEYSSINTTFGLRLQLALLCIHGGIVYQDYMMYNFGIGVSFR